VTPAESTPAARPPASAGRRQGGSLRFAAGLFVAGVAITAALIALTSGGGGAPKPKVPVLAKLPTLSEQFNDRLLGVTGLATREWVVGGYGPTLHITSTNRKAVIAIGAPGAARTAHAALHVGIAAIRKAYKHVTLKQAPGSILGGRPARSVVMYGNNFHNVRVRILLATATGTKLAYVVQVFTALDTPLRTLEESQQILATLRFLH
jgi:hypothetical protein